MLETGIMRITTPTAESCKEKQSLSICWTSLCTKHLQSWLDSDGQKCFGSDVPKSLVDSLFNPPDLHKMHKRGYEQCYWHISCARACTCGESTVYTHLYRFINRLAFFSLSDIVMEEAPTTPIPAPPVLHTPPPPPPAIAAAPALPPPPSPAVTTERDGGRRGGGGAGGVGAAATAGGRLGLTKEVLSAHTQQEEQNFMCRFRDLSQLRVFDPASVLRRHTTTPITRGRVTNVHINMCLHKQKTQTQIIGIYTHLYCFLCLCIVFQLKHFYLHYLFRKWVWISGIQVDAIDPTNIFTVLVYWLDSGREVCHLCFLESFCSARS